MRLWPIVVRSDYERVVLACVLPCAVALVVVAAVLLCVWFVGGAVREIKLDIITPSSLHIYTF